jgi:hypothetical protein
LEYRPSGCGQPTAPGASRGPWRLKIRAVLQCPEIEHSDPALTQVEQPPCKDVSWLLSGARDRHAGSRGRHEHDQHREGGLPWASDPVPHLTVTARRWYLMGGQLVEWLGGPTDCIV